MAEKPALLDSTTDWRSGKNRRLSNVKLPVRERNGNIVMEDRRTLPDRRQDRVEAEETMWDEFDVLDEFEFDN